MNTTSVRELLEILGNSVRQKNGLVFMPILSDMHDPKVVAEISHLSDVVVDFELESEHLEGKLRFTRCADHSYAHYYCLLKSLREDNGRDLRQGI